jgi:hypothetical protein
MPSLTRADLDKFTGKNIKDICPNGFVKNADNHCAHFVCHVLGYSFGYTCNTKSSGKGVCIRVHELFSRCPEVGLWEDDKTDASRLVFVTAKANVAVRDKKMENVPKKHVGIYLSQAATGEATGLIWHYSNGQDKVVSWPVDKFERAFKGSYGKKATLFYGVFVV